MNYEHLLNSGKELPTVSKTAADEYFKKKNGTVVATVNSKMLERADLGALIGEDNREMMTDNHANHARFIYSILCKSNPVVLVDTILWVLGAYRSHNFTINYWSAQLNCWLTTLKEQMTDNDFKQIEPLYVWMQINIYTLAEISNEKVITLHSQHQNN
jgi:hypothetical protein